MAQLTTGEAAEALGVSGARVRQLILAKRLPAEKKGRDHLVNQRDLEKFKENRAKKTKLAK